MFTSTLINQRLKQQQIENKNQEIDIFLQKYEQMTTGLDNRTKVVARNLMHHIKYHQLHEKILLQAQETRSILHARVQQLIINFLEFKRRNGSSIEKAFYLTFSVEQFVDRLIRNRPLVFMNRADDYLLRNGQRGSGGFENIGKENESGELILKNYLSYDEIKISALLGLSSPTHFINNGSRDNKGNPGAFDTFQDEGIYVGLVGARFEKPDFMEWQDMMVSSTHTKENGYGPDANPNLPQTKFLRMWANFYGLEYFPTYEPVMKNDKRFFKSSDGYLDALVYKERMRITIETFLLEANARGEQNNKQVYVYAVGLGVWKIHPNQKDLILQVYAETLQKYELKRISDIDFGWFGEDKQCSGVSNGGHLKGFNEHQIKIHFSHRNAADKLSVADKDKLLVASYAWDGNAFIGNEFWKGLLTATGDPAAACCSFISLLQNPEVNQFLNGNNCHFYGNAFEITRICRRTNDIDTKKQKQAAELFVQNENTMVLWKASTDELVIQFSNQKMRDQFLAKVGQGIIPFEFRADNSKFVENVRGLTPVAYINDTFCVYCPYYQSNKTANEFAINLTSKTLRDNFIKALGLSLEDMQPSVNQVINKYNNEAFVTFDGHIQGYWSQETVIYIPEKANTLFTQADSYLKIHQGKLIFGNWEAPDSEIMNKPPSPR